MSRIEQIEQTGLGALRLTLDCGHAILVPNTNPLLQTGSAIPCEPCIRKESVITNVEPCDTNPRKVEVHLDCGHIIKSVRLPGNMTAMSAREFIGTSRRCRNCNRNIPDEIIDVG